ncbi:MAG: site-specific integrase [Rhizonema sp. PD38]|nr:site-specific integrase [Rhizonema sp. PD38]
MELKPFSSHDFRRTFISELMDNGVDLSTVKNLAGHSDIATTVRYDRRGEQSLRRTVRGIEIPDFRRKEK